MLAVHYTTGQLAVLAVVVGEFMKRGACMLPIGRIAAVAGVSQTLVRNALRLAADLGHLTVEERRFTFARSLPNVVRVVAREWITWLERGRLHFRASHEQKKSITPIRKGSDWAKGSAEAGRKALEKDRDPGGAEARPGHERSATAINPWSRDRRGRGSRQ